MRLPDLAFTDADGKPAHARRLAGHDRAAQPVGHLVRALPQGDAGARRAAGASSAATKFEVVAVNIDTRNLDKPKAWLQEVGIERLAYYADPSAKVFQELKAIGKAFGMPTTLLIDPHGCELGTLAGPAEWASEDARQADRGGARQELNYSTPPTRAASGRRR